MKNNDIKEKKSVLLCSYGSKILSLSDHELLDHKWEFCRRGQFLEHNDHFRKEAEVLYQLVIFIMIKVSQIH